MQSIFSTTLNLLQKNLSLRQNRNAILTSNIANAETPGFIAKDLRFEEALRQAANPDEPGMLKQTHPNHLPLRDPSLQAVEGRVVATASDDVGNDLNTVSIDQEMERLTMNTFRYNASTEIMNRMISLLKYTINEGR